MMMRRILPFFLLASFCTSVSLADYTDGWITAGEYEYHVVWTSSTPPLIVDGGGADVILAGGNNGRLEVRSTSSPLGLDVGGIMDIGISDKGHLDYLGGLTRVIDVALNATADLRGGSINYIKSMQYTTTLGIDPHIDLYTQPGWSWMSDDPLIGIEGLWQNGSPFAIEFINDEDYDPVWTNINVVVPEPATLALLGLGGLLLRKRKQ